jgi:hypothetical protein
MSHPTDHPILNLRERTVAGVSVLPGRADSILPMAVTIRFTDGSTLWMVVDRPLVFCDGTKRIEWPLTG